MPSFIIHRRIRVIDSHTGGEPTRVVLDGGPDLGPGSLAQRAARFRERFDRFRSAMINEPHGSEVAVGALLCEPDDRRCAAGVIFFNNSGCLGMCVHGTIGVAITLAYLKRIGAGRHLLDTPAGVVAATLEEDGRVAVQNVPSYRIAKGVAVEVEGLGRISGDVAWGGNWFFLVDRHGERLSLANAGRLTEVCWGIRQALAAQGVRGEGGAVIDHIELFGPPSAGAAADSKNFVLCPGKAYDRSPCGTGTSAKLACLIADGKLKPGEPWRQESIVGSIFEGTAAIEEGRILPTIKGSAHLTAEATLLFQEGDPYQWGFPT